VPAQNPNANRGEHVKVKGKVKKRPTPATPDQQDRNRGVQPSGPKVRAVVKRKPAAKDPYRDPHEQQLLSQAHSVRLQASDRRGTTPSGDRPQGRSKAMDAAPVHRVILVDPNTGHALSTLSTPTPPRGSQQRGTSPSGDRPQGRATEMRAAPVRARIKKGHGAGGPLFAVVHVPSAYVSAISNANVDPSGLAPASQLVKNAATDAAELAVTTPSSIAKLASTAAHDPEKVPGMLAQPYVNLVKHPETAFEHPVSTALMVQPAVRAPGLVTGKVLRTAGKQTLERPAKTLPGTALRDKQTGSKDAFVRADQARRDKANPNPVMTEGDVVRRVDEARDWATQHHAAARKAAARQAKERGMNAEQASEHIGGTVKRAKQHVDRRIAEEFGAVDQLSKQGHIVTPKNATKGTIHESRRAAERVADKLNNREITVRRGSGENALKVTRRNTPRDLSFMVHEIGEDGAGGYAVIPRVVSETLRKHGNVGTAAATGSKLMRVAGRTFRSAVLPVSMKWLAGQAGDAGIRSLVNGAGPADWVRFRRVVKAMNEHTPGSGDDLMMRVVNGGQFGLTGTAREFAEGKTTLADEFHGTAFEDVAHGMTKVGSTLPARGIRKGWDAYTDVVFNVVNKAIETTARKAMAGHEIKHGPLMETHIKGLSDKAIEDAAHGLRGTEAQVQLGRAIDRAYGKYSKHSWQTRETLLHSTPFYPFYRNVVTFLLKTLPVDHPVKAAIVADANVLEEEWRKAHKLSFHGEHVPGWLMGSYPTGADSYLRLGRYTSFAPADPTGALGDLVTPQFAGVKEILHGHDFKGGDVKGNRALVAALTFLEAHVPGLGQADRVTGLGAHYVNKGDEPTVLDGKDIPAALRREFDPLKSTKPTEPKGKGSTRRAKGPYSSGYSSGYGNGGYSSTGYK
jgi:hypothetical protein